jgi:hypothetical protein
MPDDIRLRKVWNQNGIPVILRRDSGLLRLRLPFSNDNRNWLQSFGRTHPVWDKEKRCWETPKSWFNDLVRRSLEKYNKLYVIQPFRVQEKCAPACWNAEGHECNCSCMGENHGQGKMAGWLVISDTFATRWHDTEIACRLLTRK